MGTTGHKPLEGGELSIDPTENVKALQRAGALRQDDLRELNDRRIDAEIRVIQTQVQCVKEMALLRTDHSREIRTLETERVNAIRQVDVLAGNTAAERALVAIQTLATQTTAERETLRNLVATTANTIATQNAADLSRINEQISALQKTSYEGAGKQGVVDPMQERMNQEMNMKLEKVLAAIAAGGGEKTGRVSQQQMIQWIVMLILAAIAVAGYLKK